MNESGILTLIGIGLLPAAGMLCGSLAAERWTVPRRAIGGLLHAAAGVAAAVVSVELMPRILEDIEPWQLAVAFCLGAAASVGVAWGVRRAVQALQIGRSGPWMVYLAVAVDLLADGLMVGVGSAVTSSLGLMLGLSQVVANVPGGFVTVANLRDKGVPRKVRLAAAASLFVPVFIGISLGYWLLRGQSTMLQNAALSVIVGMLLLATIEDLVPEADAPQTKRWITTAAFAAGFTFFALLSLYFG